MVQRYYNLPSLKMLATFECAARHGSFKLAAGELNVTTSAISHQVKSLEHELGLRLFERGHRLVQLTVDGQELLDALSASFMDLSNIVGHLKSKHDSPQLTVGATTAVSMLWLTPRVTQFWREHGDITVSQNVRDRPFTRPLQLDLVIEYAITPPKEEAVRLFGDVLIPLCSPEYQQAHPTDLTELAQAPLIHLDAAETNWTNWPKWFKSLGYTGPIATRQRVNNYTIALQSAQDRVGIVLGWEHLVLPLLKSGKLVRYTGFESNALGAFYLVYKRGAKQRPEVQSFSRWLIEGDG